MFEQSKKAYVQSIEARIAAFYDKHVVDYDNWLKRNHYYYARQHKILRHLFPAPGRVLEVGCGLGHNLASLNPEYGLGIDCSARLIEEARKRYPHSEFPNLEFKRLSALDCDQLATSFDTIILVNSLTEIPDPVEFFKRLRKVCTPHTRVCQMSYNYLWEPLLKFGAMVGLCQRRPVQNWFSLVDYVNIFKLAEFEIIRDGCDLLMPKGVSFICDFVNRFGAILPVVRSLGMMYYCVVRPVDMQKNPEAFSVSVLVPCKNEEDNIPGILDRVPPMGLETEVVFIDDCSIDGTTAAIEKEIQSHPRCNAKIFKGPGRGKGAAIRAGAAVARGDILMILDADLSVMSETLTEFMHAIASGKGEFINGSRLVYPMEGDAMRTLNILGNKIFAQMFSFLLSQRIKDTLCGTKVIWRAHYEKALETREYLGGIDQWGDYDWLFSAARYNLKFIELPVHYRARSAGETKMIKRLRTAWVMLRMCNLAFWKLKLI